ncbi:DMT family transporter [Aureimonas fodinaquatilis]|uniref:DMT family transporter n=1 Tax=Aureimonas fodinaquatilis TaxID=2565783 RepID=A0A5B0DXP9_9HYPH|nr:DMT family transporter [Aureimonas fodinaquatilis]KAA0971128.1 DMT family transporter [Aureimonas fodinaquatilis]
MSRIFHPYVLLALATFIWGANAIAGKLAIGHISPMQLTVQRWAFASLLLLPFALPALKRDWPTIKAQWPLLFFLGAMGFAALNALLYLALLYTSAMHAMIIQSAMPLIVFTGMYFFFSTKVSPLQVVGFVITAVGIAITASQGRLTTLLHLQLNKGDALMLLGVLAYALFTIGLSRKPKIHWLSLMFVLTVSATIATVPFAIWEWQIGAAIFPDKTGLIILAFAVLLPSIASQSLYIKGVEMIGPNRANLFINLVPVFGAFLAVTVLGEPLYPYLVLSLALVLGGIALSEMAKRR